MRKTKSEGLVKRMSTLQVKTFSDSFEAVMPLWPTTTCYDAVETTAETVVLCAFGDLTDIIENMKVSYTKKEDDGDMLTSTAIKAQGVDLDALRRMSTLAMFAQTATSSSTHKIGKKF